jgi:hypothetical protein
MLYISHTINHFNCEDSRSYSLIFQIMIKNKSSKFWTQQIMQLDLSNNDQKQIIQIVHTTDCINHTKRALNSPAALVNNYNHFIIIDSWIKYIFTLQTNSLDILYILYNSMHFLLVFRGEGPSRNSNGESVIMSVSKKW